MTDQKKQEHAKGQDVFESEGFKQLITAVICIVTAVLSGVLIVLTIPAVKGTPLPETALFAPLIALFGVLMTGIFVFMTFRIDRGARHEAKSQAEFTAGEVARNVAETEAQKILKEAKMESERIARDVTKEAKMESERIAQEESKKVEEKFKDMRETIRKKLNQGLSD